MTLIDSNLYNPADSRGQTKTYIAVTLLPDTVPIPQGSYNLILIDPPWSYSLRERDKTHRNRTPYPNMTDEDIMNLGIANIASEDCYLMLWATKDHLHLALHCIEAWGFKYQNIFPWIKITKLGDKIRFGVGHYGRNCAEFLLIATKGKPGTFTSLGLTDIPAVIFDAPVRPHSTKPEQAYRLAERLHSALVDRHAVSSSSKIELFARKPREGWVTWGGECQRN